MFVLRKRAGMWKVEASDIGTMEIVGTWTDRGCVPEISGSAVSKLDVVDLIGDFIVTLAPSIGRSGSRSIRMRISRKPRDPVEMQGLNGRRQLVPYPVPSSPVQLPPVFEILDEKTGKIDDNASMDFILGGVPIERRASQLRFDGYTQSLTIRRISREGFAGSYSAGVFRENEFGVFCAKRVPPI